MKNFAHGSIYAGNSQMILLPVHVLVLYTRGNQQIGEKDAFATLSYKYKSYPERSHNFERKYHSAVMWSRNILFE